MRSIESQAHVRGESLYVDDLPLVEGTLYAAVVPSPVAKGKLRGIDVTPALEQPGVRCVLTAEDIPGVNQIGGIIPDEPLLAEDDVHFRGQPLAVVLGESDEAARLARAFIRVEIDEQPPVLDPRVAFELGELIGRPRVFEHGQVKAAFKECVHVFSGRADSGGQEHLYIETQGAYALPRDHGGLRVISSTQGPTAVQRTIAAVLGKRMHEIEVDVHRLGGGFGGKEDQASPWAAIAALATDVTGRPVKLVLHRLDDMAMTGKRHPYSCDYEIGLDKDLSIQAASFMFYQDAGAAADLSPAVLERTLFHFVNTYHIPNARARAVSCRTNMTPHTAFRGFGGPQGMFAMECAIAHAAEALKVPASDIQRANLLVDGDSFPYGQTAERPTAVACWEGLEKNASVRSWRKSIDDFNRDHDLVKKGFAMMPICFGISFTKTPMNQASALVHVYQDGSIGFSTGAVEMGQGVNTKLTQVVCDVFSLPRARVRIETTNTTRTANTSPTAASSSADLNGKALLQACRRLKERLLRAFVSEIGGEWTALDFMAGALLQHGRETRWSFEDVVSHAFLNRVSLSEHGHYATPRIEFDATKNKGRPFAYHVYGCAGIEATVDCLRGTYVIDRVHAVHDFGVCMNPDIDLGQAEGGIVQGIGWMTMEDLRFGKQGELQSSSLSTYKVPDMSSTPRSMQVDFLEAEGSPYALFKSKAIGEPPLMYGIGAYFAIRNAMRAFRSEAAWPFQAPMTPERVLLSLYESSPALIS